MDKYQEMLLELENQKEQIEKAKEQIKNARRLTQRMTPKCENCHHFKKSVLVTVLFRD